MGIGDCHVDTVMGMHRGYLPCQYSRQAGQTPHIETFGVPCSVGTHGRPSASRQKQPAQRCAGA